ncbi:hypothetical protein FGO68_gene7028 [Halteria grandinella]|uniref:Vesicle transport protein n=1 Tax=Halteria grandinella TaxID=5974 RepID=A0A8J8NJB1_HALGN|nr:hypothetical protein FGO68_gene7028 [Halteria grandinella]
MEKYQVFNDDEEVKGQIDEDDGGDAKLDAQTESFKKDMEGANYWSNMVGGSTTRDSTKEEGSMFGSISQKLEEAANQARYFKYFTALFVLGLTLFLTSLALIPMFLLTYPQLIVGLLNLGSILMLSGFAVIKGGIIQYFCTNLLCQGTIVDRFITIMYYLSIGFSVYASVIVSDYFLTIIALAMQSVAMLYYIVSGFPFGTIGLNLMCKVIGEACRDSFCGCLER